MPARLGDKKLERSDKEHRWNSSREINYMVMVHLKHFEVIKATVSDTAARFGETRKISPHLFESNRTILSMTCGFFTATGYRGSGGSSSLLH